MSESLNRCGQSRQSISLLAAGALPDPERADIEAHLAACNHCRKYFHELKNASQPFAQWEKDFANLKPSPVAQSRWEKAILTASQTSPAGRFNFGVAFAQWWRETIWPYRRVWTGLAALWLVMWVINAKTFGTSSNTLTASSESKRVFIEAYQEQQRVLAELFPPVVPQPAEPPRRGLPPPRSEGPARFGIC